MPSRTGEAAKSLASSRKEDREQAAAEAAEQDSEAQREKHDLELDNKILERLSTINALASHLRGL